MRGGRPFAGGGGAVSGMAVSTCDLSGWGRYPRRGCDIWEPRSPEDVVAVISGLEGMREATCVARGNGRAYGDSAMNTGHTVDMRRMNRMVDFDPVRGVLTAEAGVLLSDIIESFLPRGWFPPVTPGTKFVTLGGMIAADVHGKNHHKDGSFGNFVEWIDLVEASGAIVRCSRTERPDLFGWTLGGMGLTGIILRAAFRLIPVETGWIRQTTVAAAGLDEVMEQFEASAAATYSVAWIDCLAGGKRQGRSLLMLGEHARPAELPDKAASERYARKAGTAFSVPVSLPGIVLNPYAVRLFNEAYYRAGRRKQGTTYVDWNSYFYPLDSILNWNRIYGRRGFMQFQCALPLDAARAGLMRLLDRIRRANSGSFLAVLKRFGAGRQPPDDGLSFPMEGYTLTLDFAVSPRTVALMDDLDSIAADHGGRFYLAKDSRMSARTFERADERVTAFRAMRAASGSGARFQSLQSQRLGL